MRLTRIYTPRAGIREYMSNRVEDLERQVAELQAAVNGLTEELVEMKERVRQLEDDREVPVGSSASTPDGRAARTPSDAAGDARRTRSDDHVDVVERTGDGETDGTVDGDRTADGNGTAGGNGTDGDDADPADEGGTEDEDVIVPEQTTTTPDAEADKSTAEGDGTEDGESDDSDIIVA